MLRLGAIPICPCVDRASPSSRGTHNATLADQRANVLVKHLRGEKVLRHASLQGYWEENDANSEKGD